MLEWGKCNLYSADFINRALVSIVSFHSNCLLCWAIDSLLLPFSFVLLPSLPLFSSIQHNSKIHEKDQRTKIEPILKFTTKNVSIENGLRKFRESLSDILKK